MAFGLYPAPILLPKKGFEQWSVVACDQYTSQPDYWQAVEQQVGEAPSTLRLTLPEVYLNEDPDRRIAAIHQAMEDYLRDGVLQEYPDSMIYVERMQSDGKLRRGLVGMIDLEQYDYAAGWQGAVRATEKTIVERIPPRLKVRKDAALELPHVLLMMDDAARTVIEPLADQTKRFTPAYDFDLMQGGGHIRGWFLDKAAQETVSTGLTALANGNPEGLLFVVGDGNHTLATAKEAYRQNPTPLNRYTLVEVVNVHDPAIQFEPIYRVLFHVDPAAVTAALTEAYGVSEAPDAHRFTCLSGGSEWTLSLGHTAKLPVETLSRFLDRYLAENPAVTVDFIHGEDNLRSLCGAPDTLGFLFDGIGKQDLFPAVRADGSLPRKAFSMGHADDKRYYLECRRIK